MATLDPFRIPLATSLIEASAGTGKTYTITTLVLRLLLERDLSIGEILVVTFTKAATAELRDRIRQRLRQAIAAFETTDPVDPVLTTLRTQFPDHAQARPRLQAALRDFDRAAIFTIHGFCQRALPRAGMAEDEGEIIEDASAQLQELVSDYWTAHLAAAPPLFVDYVLFKKRQTLRDLLLLARHSAADPSLLVLPVPVPETPNEDVLSAYGHRWAEAAKLWTHQRSDILALLQTVGLSKATYKRTRIGAWAEELDALFRGSQPWSVRLFDDFKHVTVTGLAHGTNKGHAPPAHRFFSACDLLATAAGHAEAYLDQRTLAFRHGLVTHVRTELARLRETSHAQSFDDLLHRLDTALQGDTGEALAQRLRTTYPVALIDEFQDTDPVQWRIFQRLYPPTGSGVLFLIGDPKQAIYSFRGADIFTYLEAAGEATAHRYPLDTNYRSDPALVEAINGLFARLRNPFLFPQITFSSVQAAQPTARLATAAMPLAPCRVLFVPRSASNATGAITKGWAARNLPAAIAADVARLLRSGATIDGRPVAPSDIAVLVRTNAQAFALQTAFTALHVPNVRPGDGDDDIFASVEARDLYGVLVALVTPTRPGALVRALATPLFAVSPVDLDALQRPDAPVDVWEKFLGKFRIWGECWAQSGLLAAFRRLCAEEDVPARLLCFFDGERRLANFSHLAELLHRVAHRRHLGPPGLLAWFAAARSDPRGRAELGRDATRLRLESDGEAVRLVTMHQSKGLEYPIVYCPYLWDGTLLHGQDTDPVLFHGENGRCLDLGSDHHLQHRNAAQQEAAAENLRLLYVALTRARHHVSLVWGAFNDAPSSPLGYVLHGPDSADGNDPGDDWQHDWQPTRDRLRSLDDAALLTELHAREKASHGTLIVEELSLAPGLPFSSPVFSEALIRPHPPRSVGAGWRVASFSALTRDDEAAIARRVVVPVAAATRIPLADFPRGPLAGEFWHKIFELIDFRDGEKNVTFAPLVASQLQRFGLPSNYNDVVCQTVRHLLAAPLPDPARQADASVIRLRNIPLEQRLNELEFLFPVVPLPAPRETRKTVGTAGPVGTTETRPVTADRLADVFTRYPRDLVSSDYLERLRSLRFAPLQGYLRGFIDLAFSHAGRWYVVDYKSNFLGETVADYAPEQLQSAMQQGHYFLQYHLYVLALHRYLARRIAHYDYDTHFGGVFYLFFRGLVPPYKTESGIFVDRPPRALINDLSSVMDGLGHPNRGSRL